MNASLRKSVSNALFAAAAMASASAMATPFHITAASFTHQGGYINSSANGDGYLGVNFLTTAFSQQMFDLSTVGQYHEFTFGTVELVEANAGVDGDEMDNLDVYANFTFATPGAGLKTVTATGAAIPGGINDAAVDLTMTWQPVTVNFGTTGSYEIRLTDLSFDAREQLSATARVTLLTVDTSQGTLPEPGSLALAGIGIAAAAMARRRKR